MSKRILAIASDGFEDVELIATRDILIRSGYDVDIAFSTSKEYVVSAYNLKIKAELKFENILNKLDEYFGLFIPGGTGGVFNLAKNPSTFKIIEDFYKNNKFIGAICLGPKLLADAGILKNKRVVIYPDKSAQTNLIKQGAILTDLNCKSNENCSVVIDGKIITGLNMQTTFKFAEEFVKLLNKK